MAYAPRRTRRRQPTTSNAIAPAATALKRSSIGTCTCSDAYLSRKPTPMNSNRTPIRASVLPPMIHASHAGGGDGGGGGAGGGTSRAASAGRVAATRRPPWRTGSADVDNVSAGTASSGALTSNSVDRVDTKAAAGIAPGTLSACAGDGASVKASAGTDANEGGAAVW